MLGEYQLRADQVEEADASIREAEQHAEATEEKYQLADIIRLRGRIWQRQGQYEKARCCFHRAIARAREQAARLFELHAARDLARLDIQAGDAVEALAALRSIVGWFPATVDVPVLAECRGLLR